MVGSNGRHFIKEEWLMNQSNRGSRGIVSIIGAGPGDPDLITVKALKCIQRADVILYDRLVNDRLLAEAPDDALRIYCGKAPTCTP